MYGWGRVDILAAVNSIPFQSGLLYGSTGGDNASGGGRLWLIDVPNQSATLIGDTGFDRLGGIAFDSNGTLYGVAGGSANPGTLMTIDPLTGVATVIGSISDPDAHVDGLRFNSQGVLYGSAYNDINVVGVLVTIDPSNGNVLSSLTLVGSGNSFCPGIAFDPLDVLYGSRGNSSSRTDDFDLVDQVTGVLTPIGPMEAVISDVVFSPDGTLYGSSPRETSTRSIQSPGPKRSCSTQVLRNCPAWQQRQQVRRLLPRPPQRPLPQQRLHRLPLLHYGFTDSDCYAYSNTETAADPVSSADSVVGGSEK